MDSVHLRKEEEISETLKVCYNLQENEAQVERHAAAMTRRPRPWVATAGATCDASLDFLRLARLCEEGFVCSG